MRVYQKRCIITRGGGGGGASIKRGEGGKYYEGEGGGGVRGLPSKSICTYGLRYESFGET